MCSFTFTRYPVSCWSIFSSGHTYTDHTESKTQQANLAVFQEDLFWRRRYSNIPLWIGQPCWKIDEIVMIFAPMACPLRLKHSADLITLGRKHGRWNEECRWYRGLLASKRTTLDENSFFLIYSLEVMQILVPKYPTTDLLVQWTKIGESLETSSLQHSDELWER